MDNTKVILNTISRAWRSAIDINEAVNLETGTILPKNRTSRLLKLLEASGKIESMNNKNRLFYRKVE